MIYHQGMRVLDFNFESLWGGLIEARHKLAHVQVEGTDTISLTD